MLHLKKVPQKVPQKVQLLHPNIRMFNHVSTCENMRKSVNIVSNLVRITLRVSYLQSNSLFRKVFVVATSDYKEAHRGRITKRLTVFLPNDVSHQKMFDNTKS